MKNKTGQYARDKNGVTHALNGLQCEHTLCGNAFEEDPDGGGNNWEAVDDGPVDCLDCCHIYAYVKSLRFTASKGAK